MSEEHPAARLDPARPSASLAAAAHPFTPSPHSCISCCMPYLVHDAHGTRTLPTSRWSRELLPTATPNVPLTTVQPCFSTLQIEKSRGVRARLTTVDAPAWRCTFVKPFSCCGGSPAAAGNERSAQRSSVSAWLTLTHACLLRRSHASVLGRTELHDLRSGHRAVVVQRERHGTRAGLESRVVERRVAQPLCMS